MKNGDIYNKQHINLSVVDSVFILLEKCCEKNIRETRKIIPWVGDKSCNVNNTSYLDLLHIYWSTKQHIYQLLASFLNILTVNNHPKEVLLYLYNLFVFVSDGFLCNHKSNIMKTSNAFSYYYSIFDSLGYVSFFSFLYFLL